MRSWARYHSTQCFRVMADIGRLDGWYRFGQKSNLPILTWRRVATVGAINAIMLAPNNYHGGYPFRPRYGP